MKFSKSIIMAMVAALMVVAIIVPSAASAYDDPSTCDQIADARGNIVMNLRAGINRLKGSFALNGEILPIPQNGGVDATQAGNSYTWGQCREAASFKLVVRKGGKRVAVYRWKAFSDPSTGKLQLTAKVNKKYATLAAGERVKYHLTGLIWDKDQTITYVDESDSLRVKSLGTVVIEIT